MNQTGLFCRWEQTALYDVFSACLVCSFTGPFRAELRLLIRLVLAQWFSTPSPCAPLLEIYHVLILWIPEREIGLYSSEGLG